ncbi:MAG TPA: hypothetical protein VMT69_15120 [Kineosporiaceae bacterium]|nr:hypothetical protein [Kineosporiaceae bacterium]
MANRCASQQQERSRPRAVVEAVVACTPMTSLVAGLALGGAGCLAQVPGLAAGGAIVCAAGLYVERLQARSLRRRRRAERMRSRHEVTELRRTIAQLRQDVDAFHRALLDTEAVLAARNLPLLLPVPEVTEAEPVAVAAPEPGEGELVVVALAEAEASDWVQGPARVGTGTAALPTQQPGLFLTAAGAPLPAQPPAARGRLTPKADALVYAALVELDAAVTTRSLAYAGDTDIATDSPSTARSTPGASPTRRTA